MPDKTHRFTHVHISTLAVGFFAVLLYIHTSGHLYNMDDMLTQAPHVHEKGWKRYIDFFSKPYVDNAQGHAYGYRPLTLVSFALEDVLFGRKPAISHLISILLYGLVCSLLYILLRQLLATVKYRESIALLATLFFVAHPLHTEVVSSIKNRDELLAFFWFLGCFLAMLHYSRSKRIRSFVLATLCALLALLSKKSAMAPLACIPFGLCISAHPPTRKQFLQIGSALGLLLALFSPLSMQMNLLIGALCAGSWWTIYRCTQSQTTGYQHIQLGLITVSIACTGAWLYPQYRILSGMVALIACVLWQLSKEEKYTCFLYGVGLYIGYVYWMPWMWLLVGGVSLLRMHLLHRSAYQAYAMVTWIMAISLLLHTATYTPLAWLQVSIFLVAGIGLYVPRMRWLSSGWLVGLPLLAYVDTGSLALCMGLPVLFYMWSPLAWRQKICSLMCWVLCGLIGVALYVSHLQGTYRSFPRLTTEVATVPPQTATQLHTIHELLQEAGRTLHPLEHPLAKPHTISQRLIAVAYTYGRYLKLHILPYPLRVYYGHAEWTGGHSTSPWLWLAIGLHVGLIVLCWRLRTTHPLCSFAIFFYLAGLFPFSNAPALVAGGMGERFTFAASVGFVLAVAYGAGHAARYCVKWPVIHIACAVLLVLYSLATYRRAAVWKDKEQLYTHDLVYTRRSAKLQQLAAEVYLQKAQQHPTARRSHLLRAEQHMRASLAIGEAPYTHWLTMGLIAQLQGKLPTAIQAYEEVLQQIPTHKHARFNLAACQAITHKTAAAAANYLAYIAAYPQAKEAYANLAFLYFQDQAYEEALTIATQAVKKFPQDVNSILNLGRIYLAKDDTVAAIHSFQAAHRLAPNNPQLLTHLNRLKYIYTGD